MHPRIAELFRYLDEQHAALLAATAAIPGDKQSISPAVNAWSVAQIVEHLFLLERRLIPVFTKLIAEARDRGLSLDTDTSSVLHAFDPGRFLDRTRKIVTREATRPTGTLSVAAGLEALAAARHDLKAIVLSADGLALGTVVQAHPAFGTLNLYEWIAFLGAHTARHVMQIQEVGRLLQGHSG